jgi:FtsH-binding integral membrane protein
MTKKRRQFWFALTWAPLGAFFFTAAQPQNPNTTIGTIVFGTLGIACMITPIPLLYRWAKTPTPPTPAIENPALRPMVVLTKHGDTWR